MFKKLFSCGLSLIGLSCLALVLIGAMGAIQNSIAAGVYNFNLSPEFVRLLGWTALATALASFFAKLTRLPPQLGPWVLPVAYSILARILGGAELLNLFWGVALLRFILTEVLRWGSKLLGNVQQLVPNRSAQTILGSMFFPVYTLQSILGMLIVLGYFSNPPEMVLIAILGAFFGGNLILSVFPF
ncbi:MAG: hypothetical protein UU32_C0030G0003 [Candidatus Woesebacteria bacterium GW2011_GWB1_41_10]|uniref:Uncharacterized protein n=1 Tax=Candidatus Woesebacteria bacterium GW2011_GWB1_41_10 TaxID=1618577 RepID=A0A0G0UEN9_9BACT|nr:MAG: hypothetical protein UU32_C0030G0003 [Candidatus Woesebacteria bacterium GW2011_GWB1_41_10]